MSKHLLSMSPERRADLGHQTVLMLKQQADGEVVSYEQFIENLFKQMKDPVESLMHATIGIAGEGGELLDATKKAWIYGKPLDLDNLLEELGDLRFYYQKCLNMLELTDDDIKAINMAKLVQRYPDGVYTDKHAQDRLDKNGESDD